MPANGNDVARWKALAESQCRTLEHALSHARELLTMVRARDATIESLRAQLHLLRSGTPMPPGSAP